MGKFRVRIHMKDLTIGVHGDGMLEYLQLRIVEILNLAEKILCVFLSIPMVNNKVNSVETFPMPAISSLSPDDVQH